MWASQLYARKSFGHRRKSSLSGS
eukprot:COSAG01_NODE_30953_length_606_cov_1.613412_2_plen_23_part_01